MAQFKDFSDRDWGLAPRYSSGATLPGVVGLEFGKLLALAGEQEAEGAFRTTRDGSFGKAPVFVDDIPSALYLVETETPDHLSPNHNTADDEIVVVVGGNLRYVENDGSDRPAVLGTTNTFVSSEVIRFQGEAVSMQAVGIFYPVRALALALFREDNQSIQIAAV